MPAHTLALGGNGKVVVDGVEIAGETLFATFQGGEPSSGFPPADSEVQISDGGGELIPFTTVDDITNGLTGDPFATLEELQEFISLYFRAAPEPALILATEGNRGAAMLDGNVLNIPVYSQENNIVTIPTPFYVLTPEDSGQELVFTSEGAVTLTVPVGLGIGFVCMISQSGIGAVTLSPAGTVIHNRQSFTKTAGQYAIARLKAEDENVFVSSGDMAL